MDLQHDRYVSVSEAGVGGDVDAAAANFCIPAPLLLYRCRSRITLSPKKIPPAKYRSPKRLSFDPLRSQVSR